MHFCLRLLPVSYGIRSNVGQNRIMILNSSHMIIVELSYDDEAEKSFDPGEKWVAVEIGIKYVYSLLMVIAKSSFLAN